jgi:hypothetical protein
MNDKNNWTNFSPFPFPKQNGYLYAPIGEGVYELKNNRTKELVYVGEGNNVAYRMSSLLPAPLGAGTRNNLELRNYIFQNFQDVYYCTLACNDKKTAKQIQDEMIANNKYLFN